MLDVIEQLQRYGEAAEAAVPDSDRPVQLRPHGRRRQRPLLLVAAAVALVAGIATVAIDIGQDERPSVSQADPAPGSSGPPLSEGGPYPRGGDILGLAGAEEAEHFDTLLQMRDSADLVVVGTFTGFEPGATQTLVDGLGDGIDDQLFWVDGHFQVDEVIRADEELVLDDVIATDENGRSLTVEFFMGASEEGDFIDEDVARLDAVLTARGDHTASMVLFLRSTGSALDDAAISDPCTDWTAEELEPFGMTPEDCDADVILDEVRGDDEGPQPPRPPTSLSLVSSYGLITRTDAKPVDALLNDLPQLMPQGPGDPPPADHRDAWASLDELVDYLRTADGSADGPAEGPG